MRGTDNTRAIHVPRPVPGSCDPQADSLTRRYQTRKLSIVSDSLQIT